jgi:hypothetical protein
MISGEPEYPGQFVNQIIFVPKNALTRRTISAEPAWLSWLQQAVKELMFSYVETHPKMYTWFSNQEYSRELALKGSIDGSYATIDFSSASDSITVPLVSTLYARTPLRDVLLEVRSRQAKLPDGRVVPLTKYAPMGSATCFATMDIIFLSICERAVRLSLGRTGQKGDYTVYGDDVIIRSDCVDAFKEITYELHLQINEDKSYEYPSGYGVYRESCGIEAYGGVDVTPVRYSRFQDPVIASAPLSSTYWASTVDLMNRLYLTGLYKTRSVITQIIKFNVTGRRAHKLSRKIWENILRIDAYDYQKGYDGPIAIITPDGTATNYHQRHRLNRALWRVEVRCLVPVAKPVPVDNKCWLEHHGDCSESQLLHYWFFLSHTDDRPSSASSFRGSALDGTAGTQPDKWVWKWCSI